MAGPVSTIFLFKWPELNRNFRMKILCDDTELGRAGDSIEG